LVVTIAQPLAIKATPADQPVTERNRRDMTDSIVVGFPRRVDVPKNSATSNLPPGPATGFFALRPTKAYIAYMPI
jgi:hypothetical protein